MSLKVCAKISESVAFEAIAKAFMQHWMTCEGELDKAIDVACESLSFPIKKGGFGECRLVMTCGRNCNN